MDRGGERGRGKGRAYINCFGLKLVNKDPGYAPAKTKAKL